MVSVRIQSALYNFLKVILDCLLLVISFHFIWWSLLELSSNANAINLLLNVAKGICKVIWQIRYK